MSLGEIRMNLLTDLASSLDYGPRPYLVGFKKYTTFSVQGSTLFDSIHIVTQPEESDLTFTKK
jgi:hypothetical protein